MKFLEFLRILWELLLLLIELYDPRTDSRDIEETPLEDHHKRLLLEKEQLREEVEDLDRRELIDRVNSRFD